jgi:hypothetical protein
VAGYRIDSEYARNMGIAPSEHAPPIAVKLACMKYWTRWEKRLSERNIPALKRSEIEAGIGTTDALGQVSDL